LAWLAGLGFVSCGGTAVHRSSPPTRSEQVRAETQTLSIVVTSNGVSLDGRVIDSMTAEQQARLVEQRGETVPYARDPLIDSGIRARLSESDRITLAVEGDLPFLSVERVLVTLIAAGIHSVRLQMNGAPRDLALGRGWLKDPTPALLVWIVRDGVSIKAPGGNVATGCQTPGPGIAIPRTNGAPDYPGIQACTTRMIEATQITRYFVATSTTIPFSEFAQTAQTIDASGGSLVGLRIF
jgi:hypothetical protein